MSSVSLLALTLMLLGCAVTARAQEPLPGTQPLTLQGDLATQMVEGIRQYFLRETERLAQEREKRWKRDFSTFEAAYSRTIEPNRARLRAMLGLTGATVKPDGTSSPLPVAREPAPFAPGGETELTEITRFAGPKPRFRVFTARWPVLLGVEGEGLLLVPRGRTVANVIALPDCDNSPEQFAGLAPGLPAQQQLARRLAERGCKVLVPVLIDRKDDLSGHESVRFTNQPHREFLWRAAYEMGRTPIGYEVEKVLAAERWIEGVPEWPSLELGSIPTAVAGYGEGGLIAFYASAASGGFDATLISGYFGPREKLWSEPIFRNVFGLLTEFGDAEIASLIGGPIIVEASRHPGIAGPPAPRQGRSGAAPGAIVTPPLADVQREFDRAVRYASRETPDPLRVLITPEDGAPWSDPAVDRFIRLLTPKPRRAPKQPAAGRERKLTTEEEVVQRHRMARQFTQLMEHTQRLMRESPYRRKEFWSKADASSPAKWAESTKQYRDLFWDNVLGRLPKPTAPMNPRSRQIIDTPKYRGYEVVLDVYPESRVGSRESRVGDGNSLDSRLPTLDSPGVYAYGILLVPKDLKPGERRPVVVCQHGLEGRPQDVADPKINNPAYNQFACKLTEQGFITFSPQNPYIGQDHFRVALRMGQAIGQTLFGVIARQHERILDWLAEQPFVDPDRMAFYGLSYGGKTAMRIPAVLERYCLSICSADYNEWIWKIADWRSSYSYLFTGEYDMPEWNLANTFNYAEMSWLICPRPFMVERGHHDGVAPDEWVAYEYAKTRYRYDLLGLGDRTELEVFNGPHTIHGVGTFAFLKKHLKFP